MKEASRVAYSRELLNFSWRRERSAQKCTNFSWRREKSHAENLHSFIWKNCTLFVIVRQENIVGRHRCSFPFFPTSSLRRSRSISWPQENWWWAFIICRLASSSSSPNVFALHRCCFSIFQRNEVNRGFQASATYYSCAKMFHFLLVAPSSSDCDFWSLPCCSKVNRGHCDICRHVCRDQKIKKILCIA